MQNFPLLLSRKEYVAINAFILKWKQTLWLFVVILLMYTYSRY